MHQKIWQLRPQAVEQLKSYTVWSYNKTEALFTTPNPIFALSRLCRDDEDSIKSEQQWHMKNYFSKMDLNQIQRWIQSAGLLCHYSDQRHQDGNMANPEIIAARSMAIWVSLHHRSALLVWWTSEFWLETASNWMARCFRAISSSSNFRADFPTSSAYVLKPTLLP